MQRPLLVFDVNESLLDLSALDTHFERLFGDPALRATWFAMVLRSAMTVALTLGYRPFGEIAANALETLAAQRGIRLTRDDRDAVLGGLKRLPPHPDVPAALARLREAGFTLAALTNSGEAAMNAQLENAGIAAHFRRQISVDRAQALKPALAVYHTASRLLGRPPGELLMIAAHGWDLAGAMSAGWRTGFLARPGQSPEPNFPPPEFIGADLGALAEQIMAAHDGPD